VPDIVEQALKERGAAAIGPADGIVQRLTRLLVPQHRGAALIYDAHGDYIMRIDFQYHQVFVGSLQK